jgi:hypothetical protein
MDDNAEHGSFEDFGESPTSGMSDGGLAVGGELSLPASLTDPLAQPAAPPDYYQPIPPPVEHEPENLLQRGYEVLTDPPMTEPGPVDPVEQERIEQEMASQETIGETVIKTPEIDF